LVGKPEGKRPLGRPKRRWDQNGTWGDWLGSVEWMQLVQDRSWSCGFWRHGVSWLVG
jgi:hypothetical protein